VDATLERMFISPAQGTRTGAPTDLPVRRAPVERFPYHVIYLQTEATIECSPLRTTAEGRILEGSSLAFHRRDYRAFDILPRRAWRTDRCPIGASRVAGTQNACNWAAPIVILRGASATQRIWEGALPSGDPPLAPSTLARRYSQAL